MAIAKTQKNRKKYRCEMCDYSTCNLFDLNKHTQTKKHSQSGMSMAIDDFSMEYRKKRGSPKTSVKIQNSFFHGINLKHVDIIECTIFDYF